MLGQNRARAALHVESGQDQRVDKLRDGFVIILELRAPRRDGRRELGRRVGDDVVAREGLRERLRRGGRDRYQQQYARVVSHKLSCRPSGGTSPANRTGPSSGSS